MKHWIDTNSETDNVIGITENMIFIGSCDSDSCSKVDQQLAAQTSPVEVLGTQDIVTIPFVHIQKLVSRSTDVDVDISYTARKDIEDTTLYFGEVNDKQEFIGAIGQYMPERLSKSESKQSAIAAAISPTLSLGLGAFSTYLFIDKLRVVALVIGGLWVAGSLHMLGSRIKQPPTVTRYAMSGRYIRKFWNGVKTAGALGAVAAIVLSIHTQFPDSYGPAAIYQHAEGDILTASEIPTLLERGAEIDYQGRDGSTALTIALDWEQDDLAIALIESGADLSTRIDDYGTPLEHAMYSGSNVEVIESMLKNGASLNFELDGLTPLAYSKEYENRELEELILGYANLK